MFLSRFLRFVDKYAPNPILRPSDIKKRPIDPGIYNYLTTRLIGRPRSKWQRKHLWFVKKHRKFAPVFLQQLKPQVNLIASALHEHDLPLARLPEVAFVGRSNSGKSTLINELAGRQGKAYVERQPGSTQEIDFYQIGRPAQITLVDLPGYGFAFAKEEKVMQWTEFSLYYLKSRKNLRVVFILIDARVGMKNADREMLSFLDRFNVKWGIILTKCDRTSPESINKRMQIIRDECSHFKGQATPIIPISALAQQGMNDLRLILSRYKLTRDDLREKQKHRHADLIERVRLKKLDQIKKKKERKAKEAHEKKIQEAKLLGVDISSYAAMTETHSHEEDQKKNFYKGLPIDISSSLNPLHDIHSQKLKRIPLAVYNDAEESNISWDQERTQSLVDWLVANNTWFAGGVVSVNSEAVDDTAQVLLQGDEDEIDDERTKTEDDSAYEKSFFSAESSHPTSSPPPMQLRAAADEAVVNESFPRLPIISFEKDLSLNSTTAKNQSSSLRSGSKNFQSNHHRHDNESPWIKRLRHGELKDDTFYGQDDLVSDAEINLGKRRLPFSDHLRVSPEHLSVDEKDSQVAYRRSMRRAMLRRRESTLVDLHLDKTISQELASQEKNSSSLGSNQSLQYDWESAQLVTKKGFLPKDLPVRGQGVGRRRVSVARGVSEDQQNEILMQREDGGILGMNPVRIIPRGIQKWKVLGKPKIKSPQVRPAPDVAEFFGLKTRKKKPSYKRTSGFTWQEAYSKWSKWTAKLDDDAKQHLSATPPTKESVIADYISKHSVKVAAARARRAKQLSMQPMGAEFEGTRKAAGIANPIKVGSLFKRKSHKDLMDDARAIDFEAIVKFNAKLMTAGEKQKKFEEKIKMETLAAKGMRFRNDKAKSIHEEAEQMRRAQREREKLQKQQQNFRGKYE